jgi:hypothetical protein
MVIWVLKQLKTTNRRKAMVTNRQVSGMGMLSFLSAEQTRHITLLEVIWKILRYAGKPTSIGDGGWLGMTESIVVPCGMISEGCVLFEEYKGKWGKEYAQWKAGLEGKLFSLIGSKDEKQKMIYEAAVNTMRWQIEKAAA